jgi:hypothetical protein
MYNKDRSITYSYVDDLKLISKPEEELQTQMQVVTAISDVIQIGIGLDECAKIALKK